MIKKPTIIDIARISGYSKSTVSKVLRNEPYVKKSTKKKILKEIKKVGYQPDEIARSLVLKKPSNFIGLIISDTSNPFFAEVVSGVEAEAKKRDCNVILCNTNYIETEEARYIDMLLRNRAIGILLATATINDYNVKHLIKINYPLVLIARGVKSVKTDIVSIDNFEVAKTAVNYLIQKGHRKIAHFTVTEKVLSLIQRLEGYKSALKSNNIKMDYNLIFRNEMSIEGGYKSASELLKLKEKPTAIFAADDLVAIGAMNFFLEKNKKIPEDISIIGFDNIKFSGIRQINLTTVNQPKFEMGEKSVKILFKKINGGSNYKPINYILKTKIIERGTVLDLRHNK